MSSLILMVISAILALILLSTLVYFLVRIYSDYLSWRGGAPYVGIPIKVAREALRLAAVSNKDVLYDLGCGDGRVLKLAVQEFGVQRAIGYEIAWWPYLKAKSKTTAQSAKPTIIRDDLFNADLRKATVVFLYLFPELLKRLKQKLARELPDNNRVVVVTWGFDHPFGQASARKTIPWQPKPYQIYLFTKEDLA